MKDYTELPEGYKEIFKIDLMNNKKMFIIVNLLNLVIALIMIVIGLFIEPGFLDTSPVGFTFFFIGMWVYIILHELVHGVFMKGFSKQRPYYGFKGLYAYAGSKAYFCKSHYIIIAMAPVVIWGIVLAAINLFVPEVWFWPVYLIQVVNISGAIGDLYVTYLMSKMPEDILVQDNGADMSVLSASAEVIE